MPNSIATIPTWWPVETSDPHPYLTAADISRHDQKAGFIADSEVELLQGLGLSDTDTMIDFGAGTGTFALAIAAHCKTVIAVDISPVMIAAIEHKTREQGISNVSSIRAGLLSYQHDGEAPTFIYSRHTLHHLSDLWKTLALKRIYDLLQPGGVLRLRDLVFNLSPDDTVSMLEQWFTNATSDASRGWTRAELEHEVVHEYFTYTWLLEPMLEHVGFRIEAREYSTNGIFAAYVCRKQA